MRPHPVITRELVLGSDGLREHLDEGAVIIDCATDGPDIVQEIAGPLAERAITVLDAPVGRGVGFAARGELLLMVGGDDDAITRVMPVLDALSSEIVRCGPLGAGQVVKLANNLVSAANVAVIAEAAALARKGGVSLELLSAVLARTADDSWQLRNALERRVPVSDFSLGFRTSLALKDLRLFEHLARSRDLRMPVAEGAIDWYDRACRGGLSKVDQCAVATIDAAESATSTT